MKKLNIAELLKDCPKGMELDCTMFDDVTFVKVDTRQEFPIEIKVGNHYDYLTQYGCYHSLKGRPTAKCVIFPKGKITWEGFQRPFKDGDVVFYSDTIAIFKEWGDETLFRTYVKQYICRESIDIGFPLFGKYIRKETRFATEEEKQKLFQAIEDNGYRWNPETKTLEKLEVNKFDITTLKPFDRVLVRNTNTEYWRISLFGTIVYDNRQYFMCLANSGFYQCVPYEDNKHLLGTTDNCDEYFKTWK